MNETYIVDPDGDLFLLLVYSPGKPFAPWDHNGDNSLSSLDPSSGHAEFEAKVSSKHLALASLYFNAMLTGPWFEAENCVDGSRHIKLDQEEGFDPEALRILLDIIHGKTRRTPRFVELEILAKISVLADYFQCYEPLEIFVEVWVKKLSDSLPVLLHRDLIFWILISSVFHQKAIFEFATRIAILHGAGPMRTLTLPISLKIIGMFSIFSKGSLLTRKQKQSIITNKI